MHFQLCIVSGMCFYLYFNVDLALILLISCMWASQICVHVLTGQQEQFTCRLISSADRIQGNLVHREMHTHTDTHTHRHTHKAFFKEIQYANQTSIITHLNGLEHS